MFQSTQHAAPVRANSAALETARQTAQIKFLASGKFGSRRATLAECQPRIELCMHADPAEQLPTIEERANA